MINISLSAASRKAPIIGRSNFKIISETNFHHFSYHLPISFWMNEFVLLQEDLRIEMSALFPSFHAPNQFKFDSVRMLCIILCKHHDVCILLIYLFYGTHSIMLNACLRYTASYGVNTWRKLAANFLPLSAP